MLSRTVTASSSRQRLKPAGVVDDDLASARRDREGMTFLWILLGIVYIACWIYFGLATFSKGHYWMFWIGFFLPILWIIGAFLAPTERAAARAAGAA
jgi:hypothetical protein